MIADISSGTSTGFGTGKLRELCKMLPEEGEVCGMFFFSFFLIHIP
jgi:hypothetical protein